MAVIFITGMSGTGKSTVLGELTRLGYRVVDTDYGDWMEDVPVPDGTGTELQWREDRITELLAEHEV
ncbi:AAA family ATPase [Nonomuraea fuscirosea]